MNLIQKKTFLISSFLLLFGVMAFLLFPSIFSSLFFIIYFCFIILITLIFVIAFTKVNLPGNETDTFANSNQILFSARSVFPFQLFPDRYFVQEKTISIVRKKFFSQGWIETIAIKDIGGVRLYTGPLFSSITIIRKLLPQTTIEMQNIWKKDAFKLKELLDGLIITENNLINIPDNVSLKTEEKILTEIGKEKEIEKEI